MWGKVDVNSLSDIRAGNSTRQINTLSLSLSVSFFISLHQPFMDLETCCT